MPIAKTSITLQVHPTVAAMLASLVAEYDARAITAAELRPPSPADVAAHRPPPDASAVAARALEIGIASMTAKLARRYGALSDRHGCGGGFDPLDALDPDVIEIQPHAGRA